MRLIHYLLSWAPPPDPHRSHTELVLAMFRRGESVMGRYDERGRLILTVPIGEKGAER